VPGLSEFTARAWGTWFVAEGELEERGDFHGNVTCFEPEWGPFHLTRMTDRRPRDLDGCYSVEVDAVGETAWYDNLQRFGDANIYQTWAYGAVTSGERNISHLLLRRDGRVAAVAQARIARLPIIPAGVAYVRWGPLWRRSGEEEESVFRQAIRALRNEYVCKRGLTLRLFPLLFDNDPARFRTILEEEGFAPAGSESSNRTILIELRSSLEELREGMNPHWKRELKQADRNRLEIDEGTGEELFGAFIQMYREMVSRKRFLEPNDINQFRLIQRRLPEQLKMKILLCRSGGQVCSGAVASAMGKTAVYLFGATSNAGLKSRGSYTLQWKLIEELKREGIGVYDLNGINPEKNPGTYKFKSDLAGKNGRDVCLLGRFDSHGGAVGALCVPGADILRSGCRSLKERLRTARSVGLRQSQGS
jgi:Uncharacterized protein involved in methicillin resistance